MRYAILFILAWHITVCTAQTEVTFRIGRNHYPALYDFKFLNGIDTLPMNYTYTFDITEATGKYDSIYTPGLDFKLNHNKATIKTPLTEGKTGIILYKRQPNGKMKPVYVHYIRVRANRSQFE